MGRYKVNLLPAGSLQRNTELTAKLRKQNIISPCTPDPVNLFWFSDDSGLFDAATEAAYVLDVGGAGPTLAVAKLLGELCGEAIDWNVLWEGAGTPLWYIDDPYLFVYPTDGTSSGVLTVKASVFGQTYGPITLVIANYVCYSASVAGCENPTFQPFNAVFDFSNPSCIVPGANPMPTDPSNCFGSFSMDLALKAGVTLPDTPQVRVTYTPTNPSAFYTLNICFDAANTICIPSIYEYSGTVTHTLSSNAVNKLDAVMPYEIEDGSISLEIQACIV